MNLICLLNLFIYLFLTTIHPLWHCWNSNIFDTRVWEHRGLLHNRIPFELEAVPSKVGDQFEAKCGWEFFFLHPQGHNILCKAIPSFSLGSMKSTKNYILGQIHGKGYETKLTWFQSCASMQFILIYFMVVSTCVWFPFSILWCSWSCDGNHP